MHRSSESITAIAMALAKAQTKLSNPTKAMIGSVHNHRSNSVQNFRYASLSSGLDIIRKTLGRQKIAVAQTTNIDRPSGSVHLTTVLMHSSGEWIASDWPVCALSEVSQPRRMGAALTYARRYALFTLVGIAGEDDLDAPDGAASQTVHNQPVSDGPNRPPSKAIQGDRPERLTAEESSALKVQLIQQIEGLPKVDLEKHAVAILKMKNRLLISEAKEVEDVFVAKFVQGDFIPEAGTEGIQFAAETGPSHSASLGGLNELGCGKITKTFNSPLRMPEDTASEKGGGDPFLKIEKSELTISEPRRRRDKAHLKFVASHPCLVCGKSPADAHHLRFAQPRAMGRKVSDEFTVPLCRAHHRDNHRFGDEIAWWQRCAIEPVAVSRALWSSSRTSE